MSKRAGTLCAYPASSVAGSEHSQALRQVCHLHSSVVHPWGEDRKGAVDATADRLPIELPLGVEFPPKCNAPGQARRMTVAALRQGGYGEALVQDAALVVSELATNAVLHAGSPFSLSVRVEESILRLAVHDTSPIGAMPDRGLIARPGRGLGLIDALAAGWGAQVAAEGKVVWAELRL